MLRPLLCLCLLSTAPHSAAAETGCDLRRDLVADLNARMGQTRQGIGVTTDSAVLELFAAGDGSWTLIATTPSGIACTVASGHDWSGPPAAVPARG